MIEATSQSDRKSKHKFQLLKRDTIFILFGVTCFIILLVLPCTKKDTNNNKKNQKQKKPLKYFAYSLNCWSLCFFLYRLNCIILSFCEPLLLRYGRHLLLLQNKIFLRVSFGVSKQLKITLTKNAPSVIFWQCYSINIILEFQLHTIPKICIVKYSDTNSSTKFLQMDNHIHQLRQRNHIFVAKFHLLQLEIFILSSQSYP